MTSESETGIFAGGSGWPSTHWTLLLASSDRKAPAYRRTWEELAQLYWRPVYLHLRFNWRMPVEEAKDLTQDYFAWLLESDAVERADRERGRFRTFLRACLDNFVKDMQKCRSRQKRGGGTLHISIDALEEEPLAASEELFDREWKRVILDQAVEQLRTLYAAEGKQAYWEAFRSAYVIDPPKSYAGIAETLRIGESDVTNYLRHARETLRTLVQNLVRDTVTTSAELSQELRDVFGTSLS